jgi:hypothetical protein
LVSALACFAIAPALASGATTLGQTAVPSLCNSPGPFSAVQVATGGAPSYTVPAGGGVITSWSHQANGSAIQSAKLKMWRPAAGVLTYTMIGESSLQTTTPSALNTFPTRIAVQAGDLVGLGWTSPAGMGCQFSTASSDDVFSATNADITPGTTFTFGGSGPTVRVDVSAVLEPDADHDGFGDETQDACPSDETTQGTCPVPDTTITKRPKDKTKKKTATFEFSSSLEGSTFECKLDGGPFAACTSPHTIKVGKGKHSFEVRAVRKGQTDATPATDTWKVKKKKKKK